MSININSIEGDLFCFYVNIIADDIPEGIEYFTLYLEVFDINIVSPLDRQTARIVIEDDDRQGVRLSFLISIFYIHP